jgi:hypothetical protein
VVGAIIVWPVAWFVAMVLMVQATLGLALLVTRLLRLPAQAYDAIACGLTLTVFGGIAWQEWSGGCPVGWWLGVIGFAGIAAGLVHEVISRMMRE